MNLGLYVYSSAGQIINNDGETCTDYWSKI